MSDDQRPDDPQEGTGRRPPPKREHGRERYEGSLDAPEDADFAGEHDTATFTDEQAGGPEGIKEPESPSGWSGMDPPDR